MRRAIKYVLWALLALVMIPVALLFLYWGLRELETANFYRSRPILHSMNSVHDGVWTNGSKSARSVLLERFPIGTELNGAIPALKREAFECVKPMAPSNGRVNCQLLAPVASGSSTRWIVDLQFDELGKLTDAKVAVWNISL